MKAAVEDGAQRTAQAIERAGRAAERGTAIGLRAAGSALQRLGEKIEPGKG